jgi:hypothetical protein
MPFYKRNGTVQYERTKTALVVKPGHGRRDNFSSGLLVEFLIE